MQNWNWSLKGKKLNIFENENVQGMCNCNLFTM